MSRPDLRETENLGPGLQLHHEAPPRGGFLNLETGQWPDISFPLSEQNIFGKNGLPTTPDARLRSTLRSLYETVPETIKPLRDPSAVCKNIRGRINGLAEKSVTIKIGSRTAGPLERQALLNFDSFLAPYVERYRSINHPIIQITDSIAAWSENRRNSGNTGGKVAPCLTTEEIQALRDDLIILYEGGRPLVEEYKQALVLQTAKLAGLLVIMHTMHPDVI